MIKSIISLLMFLLIVTHEVHYIFVFKTLQTVYRDEISKRISEGPGEEELVIFNYSIKSGLPEAEWIEEDEFRYKNIMYDIIKKESGNDSVYLYCIRDEKESGLYAAMDKITDGPAGNPEDSKKMVSYFSQFYSLPSEIKCMPFCYSNETYISKTDPDLLEGEYFPESPPPRV